MIRPINRDQLSLARRARPATAQDAGVVTDLQDTLRANKDHCVGMAANMIGLPVAIIIASMGPLDIVMQNPKLVAKSQPYQAEEGCLSLSGTRTTTRYKTITVQYQNAQGQAQTQTFSDFFAEIVQHECDHLQGILI